MKMFEKIKNALCSVLGISTAPPVKKMEIKNPHVIPKLRRPVDPLSRRKR